MPALTPDTIRTLTETLSDLTDYLRENPDPVEVLALVEPLLDEYTGLPVQLADTLRALARALQEYPDTPRTAQGDLLITELRTAAWEQSRPTLPVRALAADPARKPPPPSPSIPPPTASSCATSTAGPTTTTPTACARASATPTPSRRSSRSATAPVTC